MEQRLLKTASFEFYARFRDGEILTFQTESRDHQVYQLDRAWPDQIDVGHKDDGEPTRGCSLWCWPRY